MTATMSAVIVAISACGHCGVAISAFLVIAVLVKLRICVTLLLGP